jgi:hypothetical protein
MKKENLIALLEGAKTLSSQVDIDKVIVLLAQLEDEVKVEKVFGISQALADDIANKIERTLDRNASDLVDRDSAEFSLNYDNRIELDNADVNVSDIMDHVTACLEEFVVEEDEAEDEETDEFIEAQIEAEQAASEE